MAPLNESLLAQAREAQAAQAHAQAQAEVARLRFCETLRQLHVEGASMRQMARAFGLSHQRVHQLVAGTEQACSFCGRPRAVGNRLVAGPGVHICERCVPLAVRLAEGEDPEVEHPVGEDAVLKAVHGPPTAKCSFCKKKLSQRSAMVEHAKVVRICRQCLDLCQEILAKEGS